MCTRNTDLPTSKPLDDAPFCGKLISFAATLENNEPCASEAVCAMTGTTSKNIARLGTINLSASLITIGKDFYKINDPLITEDSEIDKYIEVIDVEQGEVQAEGEVCGICSVEYAEGGDEVVKLNLCGDTFHKGCITRWLKSASKCPLCNRSLRIDSEPPPAQAESSLAESAQGDRSGRHLEP